MMDASLPQQPMGSRAYKSRRNRPCDLCRARKVACTIKTQPPCELCQAKSRPCTFINGPSLRRRPSRPVPKTSHVDGSTTELQTQLRDEGLSVSPEGANMAELNCDIDLNDLQGLVYGDLFMSGMPEPFATNVEAMQPFEDYQPQFMLVDGATSHAGETFGRPSSQHRLRDPTQQPRTFDYATEMPAQKISLEVQNGRCYRFVGPSGELDPYLISRRQHDGHLQSESVYTSIVYQYTHPIGTTPSELQPPSIFTVSDRSRLASSEPRLYLEPLDELRIRFTKLIRPSFSRQLIRIFFRFVYPFFPIISMEQLPKDDGDVQKMNLSFLAAICASSLPFIIYDDDLCVQETDAPSSAEIFRISWTALQLESPDVHLTTIQASLLILQRQAREDLFGEATVNWRLCSMALASSQTLGLNRDPSHWIAIEPWERSLRKRLWWAVFLTETWTAFGQGMSSHINLDDSDVPLPELHELVDDNDLVLQHGADNSHHCESQFYYLIHLTLILRDIKAALFTVRSMRQTTGNLQMALNVVKPLRARLMQWHQSLPSSLRLTVDKGTSDDANPPLSPVEYLNGSGSLKLAYVVAQLSLFRALLRPLAMEAILAQMSTEPPSFWDSEAATAVILGAVGSARELVKFIESLTTADWEGFWHSWSKHNFAISSTFLMHLLILLQPAQGGSVKGLSPQPRSPSQPMYQMPAISPSSAGSPENSNWPFSREFSELQSMTKRWRWALRLAERGAGGRKGLMSASLRRTEALFREWQIVKSNSS